MARKKKVKKSEFDLVHCTPDQIRETKQEIVELEGMLRADRASGRNLIQNVDEFNKEIIKKKKMLRDHAPKKLRGAKANRAYAEAKRLKKIIQDAMPSSRAYYTPYPSCKDRDGNPITPDFKREQDFEKAVQQQIAFQTNPRVREATRRYKSIMRRLEIDNPSITNIEALRK